MQELFIKDLHMRLWGKEILKGIHLEIKKGEFISLLGPSGCGKTTLIKTIALLQPDQEEIFIRGQNAHPLAPEKRGTVIVFQDLRLFPNLNVIENVEFGMRMKGVPKGLRRQKACGGPNFGMTLEESKSEDDILDEGYGVSMLTDKKLSTQLEGAVVDYVESSDGGGFEMRTAKTGSGDGDACGGGCGGCGGSC